MDVLEAFPTPPHFDHVFITVDAATFNAISECRFLADGEFGRFLIRESESTLLGRYRPIRVFGENTLIEIFESKFGEGEFENVTAGVVLSFDYPGEALTARRRLTDRGLEFRGGLISRTFPGDAEPVPWYLSTRPDMGPRSGLALFLSEMDPGYLARIGARFGEDGRQDRAAHFEAALRRPHGPELLMRDVAGVSLRLTTDRVNRVTNVLTALGYGKTSDGQAIQLRGPEAEIHLRPDDSSVEGVLELTIKLARPAPEPGRRFDFGPASSLVLSPRGPDDEYATWSFIPHKREL